MALDIGNDFLLRMEQPTRYTFDQLHLRLQTIERIMEDKLPDNIYRKVALDSLKLAIVSVAECLTEEA